MEVALKGNSQQLKLQQIYSVMGNWNSLQENSLNCVDQMMAGFPCYIAAVVVD